MATKGVLIHSMHSHPRSYVHNVAEVGPLWPVVLLVVEAEQQAVDRHPHHLWGEGEKGGGREIIRVRLGLD